MFSRKRLLSLILALMLLVSVAAPVRVHAAGNNVLACVIDPANTGNVVFQIQADGGIATDDGMLHLFAVPTDVDSLDGQVPVASLAYQGSGHYTFTTALNNGSAASVLYSKF